MDADVTVVSNAGPLMALSKLNALFLLRTLYGRVHIPRSVYDEVVTAGIRQGYEDARRLEFFLRQEEWLPEDVDHATMAADLLPAHLDTGERDTLALAIASGHALVLMDETLGREMARDLGLTVRGSLGVLIEAWQRSLIPADQLRFYFAEMVRKQDIWISNTLVERLLRELGL
jgi:predicted nucleic acid-binding protein